MRGEEDDGDIPERFAQVRERQPRGGLSRSFSSNPGFLFDFRHVFHIAVSGPWLLAIHFLAWDLVISFANQHIARYLWAE